jgi:hypothetical protein
MAPPAPKPHPITTAGSFTCADKGSPDLSSTAKLTVSTKPVLLFSVAAQLGPYNGCTFQVQGVISPCTTTTVVSGGKAAKLTAGTEAVLLDSIVAQAGKPAPPAPATVAAGQAKLTAA